MSQAKNIYQCFYQTCLPLHSMEAECVCVYASSNAKADSLSCPIVESRYVFTRFKKAERPFDCCCVGWHCKETYNRYSNASFCLQVPMSHTDCLGLSQWSVGYNSHHAFYLFASRVNCSLIWAIYWIVDYHYCLPVWTVLFCCLS